MKARGTVSMATVGIAVMLLASCVSSRKYKESQANLQAMRNDSVMLSQKVDALNGNIQECQQKTTALQQSLDNANKSYADQQKSLDNYQAYFNTRQTSMSQISQELKDGLAQAGPAYTVRQVNDQVYVFIDADDKSVFKSNTMVVTADGKQALNGIVTVLKNHPDIIITVDDDANSSYATQAGIITDQTSPSTDVVTDNTSAGNSSSAMDRGQTMNQSSATKSSTSSNSSMASTSKSKTGSSYKSASRKSSATAKKSPAKSSVSEGKASYVTRGSTKKSKTPSMALRKARTSAVANHLVKNGVPKVNTVMQDPAGTPTNPKTQVVIVVTPSMDKNPQNNASAKNN